MTLLRLLLLLFGIFGVWITYGQFKLSKFQSKISQDQLALAKQQADIAQRKVELDVRDRRYEVFKRWKEAIYHILDNVGETGLLKYRDYYRVLMSVSDDLIFIFGDDPECYQKIRNILLRASDIYKLKKEFSSELAETPIEHISAKYVENYEDQIGVLTDKLIQDKKIIFEKAQQSLVIL